MSTEQAKPRRGSRASRRLRICNNVWSRTRLWELSQAAPRAARFISADGCAAGKGRPCRLSLPERIKIECGIGAGHSFTAIAKTIERPICTVSREVSRNGGRSSYQAIIAEMRACKQSLRPKEPKLNQNPRLCAIIEGKINKEKWSPEQTARRLRRDFPEDPAMHISHETIYKHVFLQARGTFRKQLAVDIRSGKTQRRPRGANRPAKTVVKDMVMISERPAEVEDRAIPGNWEGDLIIGKNHQSAIVTLVERSTRFVMLGAIGKNRTSQSVLGTIHQLLPRLPEELFRSLTWDQGSEMAGHAKFSIDTGIQVYFCDPHSPWQRGTNENTNGLLREFFPKSTDLSVHSQDELDRVARLMNGRPRKTLGWDTPAERIAEILR